MNTIMRNELLSIVVFWFCSHRALARPHQASTDEIPLGCELLTTYRSEYWDYGSKLADQVLDVQFETELALNNTWSVRAGAWYISELGDGDFQETNVLLGLHAVTESPWRYGFDMKNSWDDLQNYSLEIRSHVDYIWSEHFTLKGFVAWDQAASGLIFQPELEWSHSLNPNSFVSAQLGAVLLSQYDDRNGVVDTYLKGSYAYFINKNTSITPFLTVHQPMKSDENNISLEAGIYFGVNF